MSEVFGPPLVRHHSAPHPGLHPQNLYEFSQGNTRRVSPTRLRPPPGPPVRGAALPASAVESLVWAPQAPPPPPAARPSRSGSVFSAPPVSGVPVPVLVPVPVPAPVLPPVPVVAPPAAAAPSTAAAAAPPTPAAAAPAAVGAARPLPLPTALPAPRAPPPTERRLSPVAPLHAAPPDMATTVLPLRCCDAVSLQRHVQRTVRIAEAARRVAASLRSATSPAAAPRPTTVAAAPADPAAAAGRGAGGAAARRGSRSSHSTQPPQRKHSAAAGSSATSSPLAAAAAFAFPAAVQRAGGEEALAGRLRAALADVGLSDEALPRAEELAAGAGPAAVAQVLLEFAPGADADTLQGTWRQVVINYQQQAVVARKNQQLRSQQGRPGAPAAEPCSQGGPPEHSQRSLTLSPPSSDASQCGRAPSTAQPPDGGCSAALCESALAAQQSSAPPAKSLPPPRLDQRQIVYTVGPLSPLFLDGAEG
eukprot:TRINITY_DN8488_c0_g1_i1.p1 TRINITY_DN8488_c0_g1~~TRINITY_DN8488_c0_g1_i1.p1  ORF type:complete len:505 (+),score=106.54 TRINITY_DN8488_c0_g1_i1:85-1515(+)